MDYNYYASNDQTYHFNPTMDPQMYGGDQYRTQWKTSWNVNIDPRLLSDNMGPYHDQDHSMQVQKFLIQPERTWCNMPAPPTQSYIEFNKPYEAQAPFPYANQYSGGSPSSTESSSALSPPPESELLLLDGQYQRQSFDSSSPLSHTASHISHRPQDLWPVCMPQAITAPLNGVSLSDLQGRPDPQEVTYNDDEGYSHMYEKDFAAEVETTEKTESKSRHYRYKSDSAIGQSIKGEDDSESTIVVMNSATDDDDADADADTEEEETIEVAARSDEEEASDLEYSPATRTSKRKRATRTLHNSPTSATSKRPKASGSSKSTGTGTKGGKNKCPSCAHTAKDAAALSKHIAGQHTRPYVCTFAFASCSSTFGNKNEWKRHVASQHLGLRVWVCSKDACANKGVPSSSSSLNGEPGAIFNRKDLFTQHLRRMHAPFKVKRQGKTDAKWEAEVRDLQISSERTVRSPPTKTCCPVVGCVQVFEGQNTWDERMEHVGRHLEGEKEKGGEKVEVREEGDRELMNWAVGEGIIENGPRGWVFSSGGARVEEDPDAEGEDE